MRQDTPTDFHSRVPQPGLEEYSKKYEKTLKMKRQDGILEVCFHTDDGPAGDSGWFNVWGPAWREIGADPSNEIIILTAAGDRWINYAESTFSSAASDPGDLDPQMLSYNTYQDQQKALEHLVFGVDVPTIGAINGPAQAHFETALLCDITICSETAVFRDPHILLGHTPGDGIGMAFQELMNTKRAAYYVLTGEIFDAHQALELGLVNEVLPADDLLPRAWELAEQIRRIPPHTRAMTKQIVRQRWKRRFVEDAHFQMAHEMYAMELESVFGTPFAPEAIEVALGRDEAWTNAVEQARRRHKS